MKSLFDNELRIVITDSGLGGLSVMAELEKELRTRNHFGNIRLIFFNSLAASDFGYNSIITKEKKAEVFNSSLNSIENMFNPHLILIACNTLSVVYEDTDFKKRTDTEVLGIIDLGIDLIEEKLNENGSSNILLLGTPTTINSNSYKNRLIRKGISESKIINQSCPLLESEIQKNPHSNKVKLMIENYLNEAFNKSENLSDKILTTLCCTHYGYSENIIRTTAENIFNRKIEIANPNLKMVEETLHRLKLITKDFSNISTEIFSQVIIKEEEINSLSEIIHQVSPQVSQALKDYHFEKNLFEFTRV
jgi:glutamate racemase